MDVRPSAYHGRGFRARRSAPLSPHPVNSEFAPLKHVLLMIPGAEIHQLPAPDAVQHLAPIDHAEILKNFTAYQHALTKEGVHVHHLRARANESAPPNLMYVRDLFFNTPSGAIIGRMASEVRAGEEKFATRALAALDVPIRLGVGGQGLFEGADALWIRPDRVLVGLGRRTNHEGFRQLQAALSTNGLHSHAVAISGRVQHLLGLTQIVDRDLVFVRREFAPPALARIFEECGYRVVALNETDEIARHQAFNFVTVAPRRVVMAAGCPRLRGVLREEGVEIADEIEIGELVKGTGGLACATGILERQLL
jgi:N-dimethylarginine dimethylaminohydrolase